MNNNYSSYHQVRIIGYCSVSPDELLVKLKQDGPASLKDLAGEYTFIFTNEDSENDDCLVVTSPVGAMHYFYCCHNNKLFHGSEIHRIQSQAGIKWEWNWSALGDLCQLENLTDNKTLHTDIHRVPPGSILQFRNKILNITSNQYVDSIQPDLADPDGAVDAFNREVMRWSGDTPTLSLSGGFDSRVILSSMLKQDIKPLLITIGNADSSDVQTAKQISREFGLEHNLVTLTTDDFFANAHSISQITNGTKTAWHWHTYLYPLKADIKDRSSFFVGTLGEFARCYYFDKGSIGRAANSFPGFALHKFWDLKLHRHPTFEEDELEKLNPKFKSELSDQGISERVDRLSKISKGKFLPALTRYYFEQRVPNFYANGIRMYQASSNWRSPFHSREWIDKIWNLSDKWKLGSNWHRYAISRNTPKLLEFPEENGFDSKRMLSKAPPLYWTPFMRRTPYISYDLSSHWYRQSEIQDYISSHGDMIGDILDPDLIGKILREHQNGVDRTRSLAFLLTLIYWQQVRTSIHA